MAELVPILVALLSFGAVAALVFVAGQYVWTQSRVQRRLAMPAQSSDVARRDTSQPFGAFVARHFGEKRFGVDETLRGKLRRELLKAGYFRRDALNYYIFAR